MSQREPKRTDVNNMSAETEDFDYYPSDEYRKPGNSGKKYYSDKNRSYQSSGKKKKKKKRGKGLIIALVIVVVVLAAAIVLGFIAKNKVSELKSQAQQLKEELLVCVDRAKEMDPDGVQASSERIRQIDAEMLNTLDSNFWKTVEKAPIVGQDVTTARTLLESVDIVTDRIMTPFCDLIRNYPVSSLKVNESDINVSMLLKYLDFMDQAEPDILEVADKLSGAKFRVVKFSFNDYLEKLQSVLDMMDSFTVMKQLMRAFLGDGTQDKTYLMMAQNSTEIRAAGGFPGQMGVLRIRNGVLSIGEFTSVYNVLKTASNVAESGITDREVELYQNDYAWMAHDASYNPHFSKVAHITRVAYQNMNGEYLDGIISLTPAVIQNILLETGSGLALSDGTWIDGTNATWIIERDLYQRYMGDDYSASANNELVDYLFAETASATMKALFGNLNAATLIKFAQIFKTGSENRTIMLWMADSAEEELCVQAGCSGNLNADPQNPVAGVYFSCCDSSKLGMFVEIDPEISEPTKLSDGSLEYTVKVKLNNYLDEAGGGITSSYILGSNGGAICSYVYFFAPAGGTVSDFAASDGMNITMSDYENLQVGYSLYEYLYPGSPVEVTYKVTTAPGVETPLRVETTPTLQNYR
ncbi:MAG: DUF4012 domain-containing protein [Parasporobacterium sp.]|nr:DUF4012 domain-containing protein [Parasporobacterium sp.]